MMNVLKTSLCALCAAFLLSSCNSYQKIPYLQTQYYAPDSVTLYDARIMPKDLITVVVSCPDAPELAAPFNLTTVTGGQNGETALQQYLVDNQGNIEFPVLGTLHVGGLTKSEAEQLIIERLRPQFNVPPMVNVRMSNYKFTVLGAVNSPGVFTAPNEKVNLLEALAMAGDMTIYGIRDNVTLIRENEEGQKKIVSLDLTDSSILDSPYYYLQQNDIVYVTPSKSEARKANAQNTTVWLPVVTTLISLITLGFTIFK